MFAKDPNRNAWLDRRLGLIFVSMVAAIFFLGWLTASTHSPQVHSAARADVLLLAIALIVGAGCVYSAWRVSPALCPPWVGASMAMLGATALGVVALQLADPALLDAQYWWGTTVDLVKLLLVLAFIVLNRRAWFRRRPIAVGLAVGIVLTGARLVALEVLPVVDPPTLLLVAAGTLALVMTGVLTIYLLVRDTAWLLLRRRLVVVMLALAGCRLVQSFDQEPVAPHSAVLTLLGAALAAAAVLDGAARTLRHAVELEAARSASLRQRIELAEVEERSHRAKTHELRSMIAGIVSARELLGHPDGLPDRSQDRLEEMVDAELGRLERLLRSGRLEESEYALDVDAPAGEESNGEDTAVDLDESIRIMATAHGAKGTRVRWVPSGRQISGDSDDVAGVLNILLDNAARHGGHDATIQVRERAEAVEIVVSDCGPGVPPELRDRLFDWGARSDSSPGEGIGLTLADRLARRHGGYVALADGSIDAPTDGASFVVGFPQRLRVVR